MNELEEIKLPYISKDNDLEDTESEDGYWFYGDEEFNQKEES